MKLEPLHEHIYANLLDQKQDGTVRKRFPPGGVTRPEAFLLDTLLAIGRGAFQLRACSGIHCNHTYVQTVINHDLQMLR